MLDTPVGIFSPSGGTGTYTFQLFFQAPGLAKYLRVGDYIKDKNGKRYQVSTWATHPSDFSSSTVITATNVDADVLPTADTSFDSLAYTPGQRDKRALVQTTGILSSVTTFSGQNFEYQLSAGWVSPSEAGKAVVGDRVVDTVGKEYEITFIDGTNRFNVPFRMKEVEPIGVAPATGTGTLFRATTNFDFYRGAPLTDDARTTIYGRDSFIIDEELVHDGVGENNTGSTITALTPVGINTTTGELQLVDPGVESQALNTVGVLPKDIANGSSGRIITSRPLRGIVTSLNYGPVYVSKSGVLTNTVPDIGVGGFGSGDWVIKVGTLHKNRDNSDTKDLVVNIVVKGQL